MNGQVTKAFKHSSIQAKAFKQKLVTSGLIELSSYQDKPKHLSKSWITSGLIEWTSYQDKPNHSSKSWLTSGLVGT